MSPVTPADQAKKLIKVPEMRRQDGHDPARDHVHQVNVQQATANIGQRYSHDLVDLVGKDRVAANVRVPGLYKVPEDQAEQFVEGVRDAPRVRVEGRGLVYLADPERARLPPPGQGPHELDDRRPGGSAPSHVVVVVGGAPARREDDEGQHRGDGQETAGDKGVASPPEGRDPGNGVAPGYEADEPGGGDVSALEDHGIPVVIGR